MSLFISLKEIIHSNVHIIYMSSVIILNSTSNLINFVHSSKRLKNIVQETRKGTSREQYLRISMDCLVRAAYKFHCNMKFERQIWGSLIMYIHLQHHQKEEGVGEKSSSPPLVSTWAEHLQRLYSFN